MIRNISFGFGGYGERKLLDVLNNADDLARLLARRVIELDRLSDRILIPPIAFRHRLVYHRNPGIAGRVLLGDAAASNDGNAHKGEVVGADSLAKNGGLFRGVRNTLAGDCEAGRSILSAVPCA